MNLTNLGCKMRTCFFISLIIIVSSTRLPSNTILGLKKRLDYENASPTRSSLQDVRLLEEDVPKYYYLMNPGDAGCPGGDELTTQIDCEAAATALGISNEGGTWAETGRSNIPGYCSYRYPGTPIAELDGITGDRNVHFNDYSLPTQGRSDLIPVCAGRDVYQDRSLYVSGPEMVGWTLNSQNYLFSGQVGHPCEEKCRAYINCHTWMWRNSGSTCYLSEETELKLVNFWGTQVHDHHPFTFGLPQDRSLHVSSIEMKGWTLNLQESWVVSAGHPLPESCEEKCRADVNCHTWMWRNSASTCYLSKDAELKQMRTDGINAHDHHPFTFALCDSLHADGYIYSPLRLSSCVGSQTLASLQEALDQCSGRSDCAGVARNDASKALPFSTDSNDYTICLKTNTDNGWAGLIRQKRACPLEGSPIYCAQSNNCPLPSGWAARAN